MLSDFLGLIKHDRPSLSFPDGKNISFSLPSEREIWRAIRDSFHVCDRSTFPETSAAAGAAPRDGSAQKQRIPSLRAQINLIPPRPGFLMGPGHERVGRGTWDRADEMVISGHSWQQSRFFSG